MAYDIGSVVAKVQADTSNFQQGIKDVSTGFQGLGGVATKAGLLMAGVFAVKKIADFGKEILTQAGNFEQYLSGFSTLLGSMEKAKNLMADLTEFSKKTPFRLEEVVTGAKQLLAYGFAQGEVVENMRMLGNVSSAVKAPLGDIVYLYGTLRTQGRAYTKDIMQFTMRGIPMWQLLADQMKVPVTEMQKMVEEGKVGFKEVETAMQSLGGETGKWGNMMDVQSQTMLGKLSNLQDAWQQMTVTLGNIFIPVATQVVQFFTDIITKANGFLTTGNGLSGMFLNLQGVWSAFILFIQPMMDWFVASVVPGLQSVWNEFLYFINVVVPPVLTIIQFMVMVIINTMAVLVAGWVANWDHISKILKGAWDFIVGVVQVLWAVVAGIISTGLLLLTGRWQEAWANIGRYNEMAKNGFINILNGIVGFISGWGGWLYDSLTEPFRRAWQTIQDLVNKIKDALDFTKRHSPSVVDIVQRGVGLVNKALDGMTVGVEPIDTSKMALATVGGGSSMNNINISMAGAYIGDEIAATKLGELMGDSIIKSLQKNVRF